MNIAKQKRGQSMVEFAVVIPLLLLLILAIFEFGRIYNAQIEVTQAAREGARAGVLEIYKNNDAAVKTKVKALAPSLNLTDAEIEIIWNVAAVSGDTNQSIKVTVAHDVPLITPVIGAFFPGSKARVVGTAQMRKEY